MNTRRTLLTPLLLSLATLAACVEASDGTFLYQVRNTKSSVAANARIEVSDRWLVFLADELTTGQGGTDFNSDGDFSDQAPVVVNMAAQNEKRVLVAAKDIAILGSQLYLVVDEVEDERDWSGDGDTVAPDDLVLLTTPASTASVATMTYVASLSRAGSGPRMVKTDTGGLYFMEDDTLDPVVAPETTINVIRLSANVPLAPVRLNNDDGVNTLHPQLIGEEAGIVFTLLDETVEGRALNTDGNTDDGFVLALTDSSDATPVVKSVGLAMASATAPVRALSVGGGDFVVAFLVDEAAEEAGSLNNYAGAFNNWRPTHCTQNDTDSLDQVLHFIRYGAWFAGTDSPVNTAFAGEDRVLIVKDTVRTYVASVVPEADDGNCATAGLNNDGDATDRVLRWVAINSPLGSSGVFIAEAGLVALADTAGGTHGATTLSGKFVVVVDEAADDRDYDGDVPVDNTLVAWLDPDDGNSAAWTFDHSQGANGAPGFQGCGTLWMGEQPDGKRLGVAFQESVYGGPINGRDADDDDSVPTFVRFDPNNADDLDFPGPAIAVDDDNAGIVITAGVSFFRVDETADNYDWNGDGDKNDRVLFRTRTSTLQDNFPVSTLNSLSRPAIEYGAGNIGIAFVADESMISSGASRDLNKDGDTNDFVVRWMRVGP